MHETAPKISIWITSTGRIDVLKTTIESWVEHCTYPNYELIILHSQMTDVSKEFFALEYIDEVRTEAYLRGGLQKKLLPCKSKLIIQPFKTLGQTYDQLLLDEIDEYYINIEDDLLTVVDPNIELL